MWETALEWGKTYGDMVYLEVAGFSMVLINSHDIATDLLTKRSSVYSSRPQMVMPVIGGWGWATPMLPYGDTHKWHRMILHKFFSSPNLLKYTESQQQGCYMFLRHMLQSPQDYDRHVRRLPTVVMMMNTFGHSVKDDNDRYVLQGEECARTITDFFGYFVLDLMPWLRYVPEWFPGANFQRLARESRQLSKSYRHDLYAVTKKNFNEGTAKECMTTVYLEEATNETGVVEDEEIFGDVTSIVFLAGSDTSVTGMMNLMLAMLKFPEAQRRAQEELDRVVGTDRLPTFEDRDRLPYVNALCSEVLRWQIVGPIALPHYTTEEDEYKGYRIPKGTIVLPNLWAMGRNADIYPDPLEFKPERFLPGGVNFNSVRPEEFVFGYGRRICPGKNWAETMLFITAATLLSAFNLEQALDADGNPIPLNEHYEGESIRYLGKSECKITPRSEKIAALISEYAESF